jgi:hypothetical protein
MRWWDAPEEGFPWSDDPDSARLTIEVDGAVAGMIQYGVMRPYERDVGGGDWHDGLVMELVAVAPRASQANFVEGRSSRTPSTNRSTFSL